MNEFEALCKLASDERWCWDLSCTTCGHMHFRYAFSELSAGKSPEKTNWLIHSRSTRYTKRLGPLPTSYSEDQKRNILNICKEANISSIAENCKFPDWLGYLGLILHYMYAQSVFYRDVSFSWASQLKILVFQSSFAYERMCNIIEETGELLNINDLGLCETDIIHMHRKW